MIGALNDNFGSLGYLIIAIFVVSWLVSIAVYRLARFDRSKAASTPAPRTWRLGLAVWRVERQSAACGRSGET